jgi:thiol-disulfide isomerase/thioredoxin
MKKKCIILLLLALANTAFSQDKFTIRGKLTDVKDREKIYLGYLSNGVGKIDSATISNGQFIFSGPIATPAKGTLEVRSAGPRTMDEMLNPSSRNMQEFYLDRGVIEVSGSNLRSATIKGSRTQSEFRMLKGALKPIEDEIAEVSRPMLGLFEKRDTEGIKALQGKISPLSQKLSQAEETFVKAQPDSYVSLNLVQNRTMDPATLKTLYPVLSARLQNTASGKKIAELINSAQRTEVGQPFIDFTRNTIDGKRFTLSSLKGKYILLDFWGSWCGPCRASFPHLKDLYAKYRDQGFEVVGIAHERTSLDKGKKNWKAAVASDGLPWKQVMNDDESLAQFDIVKAYGLSGFPTQVLIDKEGKIIARYLGVNKSLDDKLQEVYAK